MLNVHQVAQPNGFSKWHIPRDRTCSGVMFYTPEGTLGMLVSNCAPGQRSDGRTLTRGGEGGEGRVKKVS